MGRERVHTYDKDQKEVVTGGHVVSIRMFLELSSILGIPKKNTKSKRYSQLMNGDHFTNNDIDY